MKFTLETGKSKEEIVNILKENTYVRTSIVDLKVGLKRHGKFFEGDVSENSFTINRITVRRNEVLPVIKGNIEEIEGGCKVNIKMRLPVFAILFFSIWIPCTILAAIFIPLAGSFSDPSDLIGFFIAILGFCFFTFIMLAIYRYEVRESKEKLEQLLNAPL